jgi:hypothetical protein
MRARYLIVCCGLLASMLFPALPAAAAQPVPASPGKSCRMEQQCHWQDFKKICVWVKVCR